MVWKIASLVLWLIAGIAGALLASEAAYYFFNWPTWAVNMSAFGGAAVVYGIAVIHDTLRA